MSSSFLPSALPLLRCIEYWHYAKLEIERRQLWALTLNHGHQFLYPLIRHSEVKPPPPRPEWIWQNFQKILITNWTVSSLFVRKSGKGTQAKFPLWNRWIFFTDAVAFQINSFPQTIVGQPTPFFYSAQNYIRRPVTRGRPYYYANLKTPWGLKKSVTVSRPPPPLLFLFPTQ